LKYTIWVILLTSFVVSGCRWRDDFRERQQPQYLELQPEPTLNVDSPEYVGVHRKTAAEREAALKDQEADSTAERRSLPSIDNLSKIPALPEHPAGVTSR
jgi:hypothetical protein